MNETEVLRCEDCREPATHAVRDCTRQTSMNGYIKRAPMGPVHLFCDIHQRDSQQIDLTSWTLGRL